MIRAHWRCDCEGDSYRGVPRNKGQEHQSAVWARIFGDRFAPDTCPWRAYQDPLVIEVVSTFAEIGGFSEQGANMVTFMLLDPPHVLLEGLRSMRRAVAAMRRQREHEQAMRMEEMSRRNRGGRRG